MSSLETENRRLLHQLKSQDNRKLNVINTNYHQFPENNRLKSRSFTNIDSLNSKKEPPMPPPRKDFGVNCGVLTRNIGVGHQNPNTKSVATTTLDFTDKWYNEKVKFLNNENLKHQKKTTETQTPIKDKRNSTVQTTMKTSAKLDTCTQTIDDKKLVKHAATLALPKSSDFSAQKAVEVYNIGVSEDTINDVICQKCTTLKCTVGVGPDKTEDAHTGPISLATLMGSRSKSFNLGDDKLNFTKKRTVGCQYEATGVSKSSQYEPNGITRACQSEIKMLSKACQRDVKFVTKNTQYEGDSVSKNTDTKDLLSLGTRNVACETKEQKVGVNHVGCNTVGLPKETEKIECSKCLNRDKEDSARKDGSPTPSRIPRLQFPTTPVESRKFRRQDTYTKIYSSPTSPVASTLG